MAIPADRPPCPVTLKNGDGVDLAGILHVPPAPRDDAGIILLSPGVKNRVGPHRLYNEMAARFAGAGFRVLRFDFHGLGDSSGSAPEVMLADLYRAIQTGRYVEDTRHAVAWMRRTCGVNRVVLGGLCGGAVTAVLAAAGDPGVAGVIGLGLPVTLDGTGVDKVRVMSKGQLEGIRRRYLRKLLDPASWLRALTFRTDLRLLVRSFATTWRPGRRSGLPGLEARAAAPDHVNRLFPPALRRLLNGGRPVLLIYSGADRLYWEFSEKYLATHRPAVEPFLGRLLDVRVIEEANHVLTFGTWQREMLDHCSSWLEHHLGSRPELNQAVSVGA